MADMSSTNTMPVMNAGWNYEFFTVNAAEAGHWKLEVEGSPKPAWGFSL